MTDTSKFSPEVSKLFEPRPPLSFVDQIDVEPSRRCTAYISGIGEYLSQISEYKDQEFETVQPEESARLREQRLKKERQLANKKKLDEDYAKWNPLEDPHIKGDPYKTVFAARLDYQVTEIDLQKEFSRFGAIESVRVVRDKEKGVSKGYAFILFERESGARAAYKEANGTKLKSRVILTDIERSRTIKSWLPRRLGGGLGGRRIKVKATKEPPRLRFGSSRGRGGGGLGFRGRGRGAGGIGAGAGSGFRGRVRGAYDRGSGRNDYGYGSGAPRYNSRVERTEKPERFVRPERYDRVDKSDRSEIQERVHDRAERSERFEYSSRSRREDRDRERDPKDHRSSRVLTEREQEREKYRERKAETNRERMRY